MDFSSLNLEQYGIAAIFIFLLYMLAQYFKSTLERKDERIKELTDRAEKKSEELKDAYIENTKAVSEFRQLLQTNVDFQQRVLDRIEKMI